MEFIGSRRAKLDDDANASHSFSSRTGIKCAKLSSKNLPRTNLECVRSSSVRGVRSFVSPWGQLETNRPREGVLVRQAVQHTSPLLSSFTLLIVSDGGGYINQIRHCAASGQQPVVAVFESIPYWETVARSPGRPGRCHF